MSFRVSARTVGTRSVSQSFHLSVLRPLCGRDARAPSLRKYSSYPRCFGYAIDGQDVRARAHVDSKVLGLIVHFVKRIADCVSNRQ